MVHRRCTGPLSRRYTWQGTDISIAGELETRIKDVWSGRTTLVLLLGVARRSRTSGKD